MRGSAESLRSREEGIDRRQAFRFIQQWRVPALRHFELNELGIFCFHFGKGVGAQNVGPRGA
jgi:hypothetical protein